MTPTPLTLGDAVIGLQIQMKITEKQNIIIELEDGTTAVVNSWPDGERKFYRGRIKLVFPQKRFIGQGSKLRWIVVAQDQEDTGNFIFIAPRFDTTDETLTIIGPLLVELAEKMGIHAC